MSTGFEVTPKDVRHVRICGGKDLYCAHPRQGGLFDFGGGELALVHFHAPWNYEKERPHHGFKEGYKSRCVWLLQRSTDGGESWPEEENVVVFDETKPVDERREFLARADGPRASIDLAHPDSIVVFGRTWLDELNESGRPRTVCFALRSADRGRSWEDAPTVIKPPPSRRTDDIVGYTTLKMPDGTMLLAATLNPPGCIALYGSDDDGLSWEYLSEVARSPVGLGAPTYAGLVLLPDGRIQCYMLALFTDMHAMCVSESRDAYAWTPPRPIVRWGHSPWRERYSPEMRPPPDIFPTPVFYRSPWPLLLRDGRVLVVFARRKPPYGIGAILSEDEGATWSKEFIIRSDASGTDLGYSVLTQLEDGRVLTAYYYMLDDGNPHGGSRFIGGSFFRV